jgi:hypothetical protein
LAEQKIQELKISENINKGKINLHLNFDQSKSLFRAKVQRYVRHRNPVYSHTADENHVSETRLKSVDSNANMAKFEFPDI